MARQPQAVAPGRAMSFEADGRRALATAARGEAARRAARPGNIDELASRRHFDAKMSSDAAPARGRRHFAPSSAGRPLSGILPDTTDSYDAPKFASRRPRHYFDETVRASRYAELLGRAEDRLELGGLAEGALEVADGEALPLCIRRVLRALTPAAHDKDLTPAAQERCRREVEAGLHRLLASHRQAQTPCQRPSATQDPEASEALDCVPEDDRAGEDSPGRGSHGPSEDSPGAENHGPPQDEVQVAPRVGPLPTLLTSGRSWEKLILALGEMGKADRVVGESFGEKAA